MTDPNQLRAVIADAVDRVVARDFTEVQLQTRAAAWQHNAPEASLAEQTAFMLQETRALTEALLTEALLAIHPEADHD